MKKVAIQDLTPRLVLALLLQTSAAIAAAPSLDEVMARVTTYTSQYGSQLTSIVAEEYYSQSIETEPGTAIVPRPGVTRRLLRSDFVLTRLADTQTWVAFRDAFEVDGAAVRDRSDRLIALLSDNSGDAWRRAAAIANESARYNIGSQLITRNVNVPTFVLELLHGQNRRRFKFSAVPEKKGSPASDTVPALEPGVSLRGIEYRERERPTIVRQQRGGGDQPLRGTIQVNPDTGEVWQTHMTWERGPGGFIDVTFARVQDIDVLVPVRMVEAYRSGPTMIRGEATYSNFRRFETSSRVVVP